MTVTSLRARKRASLRLIPLSCGCRDNWICRCGVDEPTDQVLNGWRDAGEHLLAAGITPVMPAEIGRALWRRGGVDRELVSSVASRGGFPSSDPPDRPTAA